MSYDWSQPELFWNAECILHIEIITFVFNVCMVNGACTQFARC